MRESVIRSPVRQKSRALVRRPQRLRRAAARWRNRLLPAVARNVELTLALAAYALLPIWPLVAAALARDLSYVVRYHTTLAQVPRHIHGAVRARSVSRYLVQKLSGARPQRGAVRGTCTHCGNCCLYGGCVYLGFDPQGRSRCRIYGSRLWKVLACGEYPVSSREIRLYDCPGFIATPSSNAGGRPIPVPVVRDPRPVGPSRAASRTQPSH